MKQLSKKLQAGFTLLEMVLVLFLIGLMASATLILTENVEDQAKYDETRHRIELMRKAIVGDPSRTLNGQAEISGFVADMGRLPGCVRELLHAESCSGSPLNTTTLDASTGLGSIWRGPYIQVVPERDGSLHFRDGYGNSDASDAQNSGWKIWQMNDASGASTAIASNAVSIKLQSYGYDPSDASNAYPTSGPLDLVVSSDWLLQQPVTISVTISNQTSTAQPSADVSLALSFFTTDANYIDTDLKGITAGSISTAHDYTLDFTLDTSEAIAIGTRGYIVSCSSDAVFDGDCDSGNGKISTDNIRYTRVAPRQTISDLNWIIE